MRLRLPTARAAAAVCAAAALWAATAAATPAQPSAPRPQAAPNRPDVLVGAPTPEPEATPDPEKGIILPIATNTPTPTRTPTPINVGNFVWDDLDSDGRQDAGEPGVAGVNVQLWNAAKTQLLDTAVTNASGNYTLVAPVPGDYRVRVIAPAGGTTFTSKDNASATDQTDSDINPSGTNTGFTDVYTFGSNLISITTIDCGLLVFKTATPTRTPTPINVGNRVWHDLDEDGVQDAGEPGVPFVTVQLWNAAKTLLLDSDVTDANGNYTLVAPLPGDYRVRVLKPAGSSFTTKDSPSATDQTDSDINVLVISANFGFTDVYTFASNLISITTIDCGLRNVPAGFTPTATHTPTATPTGTLTPTPTATPEGTPPPDFALEPVIYVPIVQR